MSHTFDLPIRFGRHSAQLACIVFLFITFIAHNPSLGSEPLSNKAESNSDPGWTIAIHGGAGTIAGEMTAARETVYHTALRRALAAGSYVLAEGGAAVDAVEEAVRISYQSTAATSTKGGWHHLDWILAKPLLQR